MGLKEVFKGEQSLGSWLTGQDPKTADVFADFEMVDTVREELQNIASQIVENARGELRINEGFYQELLDLQDSIAKDNNVNKEI